MDKVKKINIKILNPSFKQPTYGSKEASCLDLYSCLKKNIIINSGDRALIPTGFALILPPNYEAIIRPRSGLALNHGITILNSPGTIDPDYQGEIKIILINLGKEPFTITHHMRIAQMKIQPYQHQYKLNPIEKDIVKTDRHEQGFGSTGLY